LRPGYRELDPNGEAAKKRRENRASQGKPAADCR
jgi:hypothetical protein